MLLMVLANMICEDKSKTLSVIYSWTNWMLLFKFAIEFWVLNSSALNSGAGSEVGPLAVQRYVNAKKDMMSVQQLQPVLSQMAAN
jgi:hypothetical protein